MKKISVNNKGFGAIGVLAIIVVLGVVGGASAYVYHHNHKTKAVASKTSTSTPKSTSGSTTPTKPDPYAGWKTYTSTTGNFSFKYPADWYFAAGGTGSSAGEISLEPTSSQTATSNAFRMTLNVETNPDTAYQPAAASKGTTQKLANGIQVWTTKDTTSTSPNTPVCPVMEMMNAANTHFSYPLSGGNYLTLSGGYCQGQRDVTTYTYQQQLASQDWQTGLKVVSSIVVK